MPRPGRSAPDDHWVALAAAPDQLSAELWLALLQEQGIPAMLHPGDVSTFMGLAPGPVRVIVPPGALQAASVALGLDDSDLADHDSRERA